MLKTNSEFNRAKGESFLLLSQNLDDNVLLAKSSNDDINRSYYNNTRERIGKENKYTDKVLDYSDVSMINAFENAHKNNCSNDHYKNSQHQQQVRRSRSRKNSSRNLSKGKSENNPKIGSNHQQQQQNLNDFKNTKMYTFENKESDDFGDFSAKNANIQIHSNYKKPGEY